ncbi:major histocompatibility complex class I-related gene protein-like [Sparus aurata]|uniref:major histocompatibility complex class I-related gene protein-like n=1 Tax=Sparus aurata TaxID=8175 RepID=UPI0011C107A1|nr:major histocompatibility complex class I-related gene protein-like [Sparus aurata]
MRLLLLLLLLLSCRVAAAVIHSLRYAHTGSSEIPNVPDTVAVVIVDGYQTNHYDSITRKMVPTQTWMSRVSEDDPDYWERETSFWRDQEQYARMHIEFYKERFNQSGGIHVLQVSHGCEWDDETGEVHGFDVVRYDGEDVLILDVKARRWIAMKPQALSYQHRYNKDEGWLEFMDHRLLKECPESLKKSLDYGKSTLQRTELPSVYLLQKTPSSPVSCLATGFYPHRAAIFWRKDGEEIHEQVDHGELLNNHDGSFQMSVDLNMSLIRADDWRRYHCVFQLSGVEEDMVTELDPALIRTNWVEESSSLFITVAAVITVFIILTVFITVTVYRRRKDQDPSPSPEDVQLSQRLKPES